MNLRESITQQFKQPRGILGKFAGHIMANRPSNIERNHWMLDMIQFKPGDTALEIGYGPGLALKGAAEKLHEGLIVGIDHSQVMYEQARQRLADFAAQGKVQLMLGDIETKPNFDITFNHIYSANVVMFWRDPAAVFSHLKSRLRPSGDIVSLYMPRHKGATDQDAYREGEKISRSLKQAGFDNIRIYTKQFGHLLAVCVVAKHD